MEYTIKLEDKQVYDSLVLFLKSLGVTVEENDTEKFSSKRKLSSLEGKVSKMSSEEIDKQIKELRDEWQRDF